MQQILTINAFFVMLGTTDLFPSMRNLDSAGNENPSQSSSA